MQSSNSTSNKCRNVPGSAGYPSPAAWGTLNSTVSGRLHSVVPSAKYCASLLGGACTDAQWTSALFRAAIPGAMDQVNWEQGYDMTPPSLCLQNATTCGQGDVPNYSVEAQTVEDIQAAVKFASKHNLRVVIKSSGHDYLGRSTAPNSLLIWTYNLQNITFTDSFKIGSRNVGPALTVGPGVHTQDVYQATKEKGLVAVTGAAASVCHAGGYIQGGGHSALSPLLGLAADNALEFSVVVASGELLKVNSISHPDLFYALRGGGAGSWGVIVSATMKTFPAFNVTSSLIIMLAANDTVAGNLTAVHAKHIFDWDTIGAGQYFWLIRNSTAPDAFSVLAVNTYMPKTTTNESMTLFEPFMKEALALPGVALFSQDFATADANDALHQPDDGVGSNTVLGSRLIPAATYRDSPAKVGQVYEQLLQGGSTFILGHLVAGGKVAENANISSAVHPAWRTAKTHIVMTTSWNDSTPLTEIHALQRRFKTQALPILEQIAGPNSGAYSNEADLLEDDFKTTFFGPNYARLSGIKRKYDPKDLFIVGAGVGSERWDQWGMCKI
ncbi:FAD-binding domain-containing protein [Mycena crocata]|nr:FAD-binding domain-containing protein [Mycena crocata]